MTAQWAVVKAEAETYPERPPFSPDETYPEYLYTDISAENAIYSALRELLRKLELDEAHYGTKRWNPLGEIIRPGDDVVIKPNFVSQSRTDDIVGESIVTHGSVLRPLIDYCLIALKSAGTLVVADAPQTDSDFQKIKATAKIQEVLDFINEHSSVHVALLDLRKEYARNEDGVITERFELLGDPMGYSEVDLQEESAFHAVEQHMHRAYGSDYDVDHVRKHHTGGKHEYYVANTVLHADVIINVPKLKTHKKAGITGCLKNAVGINGNKNYLPHFRFGSCADGGDEYAREAPYNAIQSSLYQSIIGTLQKAGPTQTRLMKATLKTYSVLSRKNILRLTAGNWRGNDTIWRTIVDLNRILLYADKFGHLQTEPQRKHFAVVDGIIGGEGDGPFNVAPRACGMLFGGFNPVLLDSVIAGTMGFDWRMIPQIVETKETLFPALDLDQETEAPYYTLNFQPPSGWECLKPLP
jgi:uncharacterized protein (DUF362 family)